MAGIPFTCMPLSSESRFQPQEFRVLLLRRLWQPLPLSSSICRCGRPLDSRGHHRRSLFGSGGLGTPVGCSGKRSSKGLPRGRRTSDRMDLLPLRQVDNRRLGGRRRWPPPFPGSTIGHRHHDGLSDPPRRNSQETMRLDQRSCVAAGTKGAKRGHTQSSLGPWDGPDWWCSVARSGEGGPQRSAVS